MERSPIKVTGKAISEDAVLPLPMEKSEEDA
jgi:hypothetical protein